VETTDVEWEINADLPEGHIYCFVLNDGREIVPLFLAG
jgi:hypothetical protein